MKTFILQNFSLISSIFLLLIFFIFRNFKKKKESKLILEGIIKLVQLNVKLENEILIIQTKYLNEICDTLYYRFYEIFCKNMNLNPEHESCRIYNKLVLEELRKESDKILLEACVINNFINKNDSEWLDYVFHKRNYILSTMMKKTFENYIEKYIGFPHKEVIEKCLGDIIRCYDEYIYTIFNQLREISNKNKIQILKNEKQIIEMENLILLPKPFKYRDNNFDVSIN